MEKLAACSRSGHAEPFRGFKAAPLTRPYANPVLSRGGRPNMKCFLIVLVVSFFTRFVVWESARKASLGQATNDQMPQSWLAISDRQDGGRCRIRSFCTCHLVHPGSAGRSKENNRQGCKRTNHGLCPKPHNPIMMPHLENRSINPCEATMEGRCLTNVATNPSDRGGIRLTVLSY